MSSQDITVRTADGLHLAGTLELPDAAPHHALVMVHGGGVTREEGGFFTRLAASLSAAGIASLRFDLRGHGDSEGRQEESTLAAYLNDIRVALEHVRTIAGVDGVSLLGASFGGGLSAYYAARGAVQLASLVLLNPQLRYKDRYIDQKPHWHNDQLSDEQALHLHEKGYVRHSSSVKHGRAFLNEVFWVDPFAALGEITAPTLIVHGTEDTFVSVESSQSAKQQLIVEHELIEIEGAQHGFAVHDDPKYADPQSQQWQARVIGDVVDWICAHDASATGV